MSNVRGLYPPLYGAAPSGGGGGGGGGQHIQVDTLPEASLANKDKIVQYVGATTETLTNAYFYKCVETTGYDWEETEASETYTEAETLPMASAETIGTIYKVGDKYYQTVIVLTYSWGPVEVMYIPAPPQSGITISETETKIGTYGTDDLYAILIPNSKVTVNFGSGTTWVSAANTPNIKDLVQSIFRYDAGDYSASLVDGLGYSKTNKTINWTGHFQTALGAQYVTSKQLILIYTKESEV